MPLSPEQETYNQSSDIDWNVFYNSLSTDDIIRMEGALSGTGINGETNVWENSGNLLGYIGKTYDDLYNQFTEHLADGDLTNLILAIKAELDTKGEVSINGKKLIVSSFDTPGTTDISGFFATPADQFDPLEYVFDTPQSIALLHFARNLIMEDQGISYLDVIKNADEFTRIKDSKNEFHKLDNSDLEIAGNVNNVKWTSADGLSEYIFKSDFSIVDDVVNAGSYNFFAPTTGLDGYNHIQLDVFTWIAFGNLYGDTTTVFDRGYDGVKSDLSARFDTSLPFYAGDETEDQNFSNVYEDGVRFHIVGGSGNDFFMSASQDDHFVGNEGSDTVSYQRSSSGISVNLELGKGYDGYAAHDDSPELLWSIENIIGSDFTDVIVGSTASNKLEGMGGNDSLAGEDGHDILSGGAGNDYLEGGEGRDTALYSGDYKQHTILTNEDGSMTVVSRNSAELGTDLLVGIDVLEFSDAIVTFSENTENVTTGAQAVGGPVNISEDPLGLEVDIDLASLVDGGFLATWSNTSNIYGQRYSTDGATLGSEFQINTTLSSGKQQRDVDTSQLSNGNVVAVWNNKNGGLYNTIRAQIIDQDGNKIGSEISVSSYRVGEPEVISLADGGFLVAWSTAYAKTGSDRDGFAVRAHKFDSLGNKVGSEIRINTKGSDDQEGPDITALADGGFAAAWIDGSFSSNRYHNIKFQMFDANGSKMGSELLLSSQSDEYFPSVSQLDNGMIVVVWGTGGTGPVKAQMISSDGQKIGTDFNLTGYTGNNAFPEIVSLADGRFVVTWTGIDSSLSAVHAQVFNSDGTAYGDSFIVNSVEGGYQEKPSIAVLDGNRFVIGWDDSSNFGSENWNTNFQIFDLTSGEIEKTITRGDTGNVRAWESYSDTFDSNGARVLRDVTFDDGRIGETTYTDGVRSSQTMSDLDDAHSWESYSFTFDADGARLFRSMKYDDGKVLDTTYVDDAPSVTELYDTQDAYSWSSQKTFLTSDNKLSQKIIDYDDGKKLVTDYENDVRDSSAMTDTNDVFAWASIQKTFLADGTSLGQQVITYDDGRQLVTDYSDGVRMQSVMTDVDDIKPWDNYTIQYDANGNKVSRTMIFDDAREVFTSYEDAFLFM